MKQYKQHPTDNAVVDLQPLLLLSWLQVRRTQKQLLHLDMNFADSRYRLLQT